MQRLQYPLHQESAASVAHKVKIAEVFDEPGCDKSLGKNGKDRKNGCIKQLSPGAAAGGFAMFRGLDLVRSA